MARIIPIVLVPVAGARLTNNATSTGDISVTDNDAPYTGEERRKGQRRKEKDRRTMVRFEPEKEPRRKNNGRRKDDGVDIWDRRDI